MARQSPTGAGFLLSQLGPASAQVFAAQLSALGLRPALVGLMRAIDRAPGSSQRAIAAELHITPSKLVALLDELAEQGLIERRPHAADRRQHAVHLSTAGERLLRDDLAAASRAHEDTLLAALSADERRQLAGLLRRVADDQGLVPGVHPGYRTL